MFSDGCRGFCSIYQGRSPVEPPHTNRRRAPSQRELGKAAVKGPAQTWQASFQLTHCWSKKSHRLIYIQAARKTDSYTRSVRR